MVGVSLPANGKSAISGSTRPPDSLSVINLAKKAYRKTIPAKLRRTLSTSKLRIQSGITSNYVAVHRLPTFHPYCANYWVDADLTFRSADTFPRKLVDLLDKVGPKGNDRIIDSEEFCSHKSDAAVLASLFRKYGSDKSSRHDYHLVYGHILGELGIEGQLSVIEIGLGTSNPRLVSTMGPNGRPGASVRAFRDFLPNSEIFGADVDRDILFEDARIRTAFVNQRDPATFDEMKRGFRRELFDLIIDDGLHSVEANLNTLDFALRSMSANGWVVIEDIPERTIEVWKLVQELLSGRNYHCGLLKCKYCYCFFLKRL